MPSRAAAAPASFAGPARLFIVLHFTAQGQPPNSRPWVPANRKVVTGSTGVCLQEGGRRAMGIGQKLAARGKGSTLSSGSLSHLRSLVCVLALHRGTPRELWIRRRHNENSQSRPRTERTRHVQNRRKQGH